MIRILHTIDTTGPGGAENVFVNLAKGLDPRQFSSFAAITGPGWVHDELKKNGIEPFFIPSQGGYNFKYLLELIRIIRQKKIDVVQSHLLGSNLYSSLAGMICRVPVVSTFHGFVDASENDRLMPIKNRVILLGSKKIVFVSERLREHFLQRYHFPTNRSETIYNGVDTSVFRPQRDDSVRKELGIAPGHILIGALGNIRPAKGYEYFLKAARLVCDEHPECRFAIAGEGSGPLHEDLLKLRRDLKLEGSFFFLGFREDAAKVLNNLDIFLLPSVSEGFSISTIEAMACRIPVIVTRSGGPEEIVQNGMNGISVGCDASEMANAILRLIDDVQLCKNISYHGYSSVIEKFTLSRMINEYRGIYQH